MNDRTREGRQISSHLRKLGHLPCIRGTWDAEITEQLLAEVATSDYVFTKHRASCFYATTLEVYLRMRGVRTLIVAAVTTNYCVESTVRDAYARDLDVIVVEDCVAGLHPDLHVAALRNVVLYHGAVATLDDTVRALEADPSNSPVGA